MSFFYHQPRDERGRFGKRQLNMFVVLGLLPLGLILLIVVLLALA